MGNSYCKSLKDLDNYSIHNSVKHIKDVPCNRSLVPDSPTYPPDRLMHCNRHESYDIESMTGYNHRDKLKIFISGKKVIDELTVKDNGYSDAKLTLDSITLKGKLTNNSWKFKIKKIPIFMLKKDNSCYITVMPGKENASLINDNVHISYNTYDVNDDFVRKLPKRGVRVGHYMFTFDGSVY